MYDEDDDESSDSDYGSKDAESRDDEVPAEEPEERKIVPIPAKRQRLADEAWREMITKDEELTKTKMAHAIIFKPYHFSIDKEITDKKPKPSTAQSYDQIQTMLKSVFGNSSTSTKGDATYKSKSSKTSTQADLKDEIKRAVAGLHHKQIVTESVKFAGKEVKVKVSKDVVGSSSGNSSGGVKPAATKRGLDDVLDTIKGPRVVSTVDKSAMDWTNFKEQEGLEDALAAASKEGYLTRQEFLNRCDVRAFERERDERLTKQAAAASSSSSGPAAV